jgi:hypothetical protein
MNKGVSNLIFPLFLLVSCGKMEPVPNESPFSPTRNGFGVVVKPMGIDSGPQAKLYYKGTNNVPVLVWPFIGTRGYPILYKNDVALLLAEKPNNRGEFEHARIIVDQGIGPAMDISNDLLKIAASQNHVDFARALKAYFPLQLNETDNGIKIFFLADKLVDRSLQDLELETSWDQIFAIMRDVRTSGKTNKVVNTDVVYLEKEHGQ